MSDYSRKVNLVAKLAVIMSTILIFIKSFVYFSTNSVTILASLMDSLFDLLASAINLILLKQAMKPADDDHTFGHGKIEYIAVLFQGVFIIVSAILLFIESISRFNRENIIDNSIFAIVIMLISMLLTSLLVIYQTKIIRETGSQAIKADSINYKADLIMYIVVVISLLVSTFSFSYADAIFGVLIALYIFINALIMLYNAIQSLIDVSLPKDDIEAFNKIIDSHPEVLGYHDLKTRQSGQTRYIQFHLELNDNISLKEAHDVCDEIETALEHKFNSSMVIIHQEPISIAEQERKGKYKPKCSKKLLDI